MMKYLLSLFTIALLTFQINAQICDNNRYINDIFEVVDKETVKFGENEDGLGVNQELFLDIYTPSGDTETMRPLIILAYGGSFVGGERGDMENMCRFYAHKGYVTAALDYRLYNLLQGVPDSSKMMDVVVKAVADMKASVRYMKKTAFDGNMYGIDTTRVYVGGISAGAITALHTANITTDNYDSLTDYIQELINDNGGIDGDTDLPGDSHAFHTSDVHAVINLSGALHRANFIESGAPPIVSAHGNQDGTVPYGWGYAVVFGIEIATLQGSSYVHQQALSVGTHSELYTVDGGGHVEFYGDAVHGPAIDNMVVDFLYRANCNLLDNQNIDVSNEIKVFPVPAYDKVSLQIEGNDIPNHTIELIDVMGRVVSSVQNNTNYIEIERNRLNAGIYYIHIEFDDKDYAPVNKKIIFN